MEKIDLWVPGWFTQLACIAMGLIWLLGPIFSSENGATWIAAGLVIGVMRQIERDRRDRMEKIANVLDSVTNGGNALKTP